MHWKTIKSELAFDSDFFTISKSLCKKKDGSIVENFYRINRPDVVIIGALTNNNKIILINQYRHAVNSLDIELPAGYCEDHEVDLIKSAERELLEETGYKAEKLIKIHETFASAGIMNNKIHFFLGLDAKKVQEPQLDENEEIEVRPTDWDEAMTLLEEEKIKDLASVAGILLIKKHLKNNQI